MITRAASTLSRSSWLGAIVAGSLAIAAGCGEVADGPADAGDAGAGASAIEYAPYYYTYGWGNPAYAFSSPADMKAKGGPAAISLAFVLSNGGCDASTDIHDHLSDVRAYIAAGGHVKASFGGATGTYLENACGSAAELAAALDRFVDDTGITDLDFDVEQHAVSSNVTVNARRAAALKQVQDTKHVRVAFTLPVTPTGLLQESFDVLHAAVAAGVDIAIVNGLAMDFGNYTNLATAPMQAIDSLAQQLRDVMPGLSIEQLFRKTGGTVMIGKNDDEETLSLDNADYFVGYALARQLGFVSFWAIQRDQPCPPSNDVALCSQLNTKPFEFHAIFAELSRVRRAADHE